MAGGRELSPGVAGGTGLLPGIFRGTVSRRAGIVAPAPRRDLSAAAGESEEAAGGGERGCGSGEGECGLKWPRRAAGVGCAMRGGLIPRAARWERGSKPHRGTRGAAQGRAALGPAVGGERSRPPENVLCDRLGIVFQKMRIRGVPPLNFWVPDLVPPHLLHPGGGCPFPLPVPLRGTGSPSSGSCSGRNTLYFV